MYNFNKKQKIILGALMAVVLISICYYVYAKDENSNTVMNLEDNLEVQEEQKTEDKESYSDDRILVHVSGAVNKEGIVELKVDSRISDAVDKAGGIRDDAYIERINLAYKLEDGMKIYIPTIQEKDSAEKSVEKTDSTYGYVTTSSGVSGDDNEETVKNNSGNVNSTSKNLKVNINTATQVQLETLSGIGPSTASKIIAYRKEKGKFSSIDEIKEVSGIGDAKFNKIKDFIVVK